MSGQRVSATSFLKQILRGDSFAMSELQITIATLVRRFQFELVDTIRERDVDIVRDCFLSEARPGTRGVKVKVVDTWSQ